MIDLQLQEKVRIVRLKVTITFFYYSMKETNKQNVRILSLFLTILTFSSELQEKCLNWKI